MREENRKYSKDVSEINILRRNEINGAVNDVYVYIEYLINEEIPQPVS
jgi:hypothetical protein